MPIKFNGGTTFAINYKAVPINFDPPVATTNNNIIKEPLDKIFKDRRSSLLVLPSFYRQIMACAHKTNCWIAGGAALSLYGGDINKIRDWDIFGDSKNINLFKQEIIKEDFKSIKQTKFSETYKKQDTIIQIVKFIYPNTVSDIFNSFDFFVCCFAIEKDQMCYIQEAKDDFKDKALNINNIRHIGLTLKRIARYGEKGYSLTTEAAKRIVEYSKTADPSTLEEEY